jgi:hypothetical protein
LRASKPRYSVPVYHPTDSHWNDLGAFIAYQKIIAALAATGRIHQPELATLDGVEIRAEAAAGGDVATRLLFLPGIFLIRTSFCVGWRSFRCRHAPSAIV